MCNILVEVKPTKNLGGPNLIEMDQNQAQN